MRVFPWEIWVISWRKPAATGLCCESLTDSDSQHWCKFYIILPGQCFQLLWAHVLHFMWRTAHWAHHPERLWRGRRRLLPDLNWDLNPRPRNAESRALTTRPCHLPLVFENVVLGPMTQDEVTEIGNCSFSSSALSLQWGGLTEKSALLWDSQSVRLSII